MEQPPRTRAEVVRRVDKLMGQGKSLSEVCALLEVDLPTLLQWVTESAHNPAQVRKIKSLPLTNKRFWLFEIWDEYRETFKALVAHTLIFALLLGLLVLSHIVINKLDYPPERKELFDKIHYAGYVAVLIVFLISFIIKLMAFEYKGMKK